MKLRVLSLMCMLMLVACSSAGEIEKDLEVSFLTSDEIPLIFSDAESVIGREVKMGGMVMEEPFSIGNQSFLLVMVDYVNVQESIVLMVEGSEMDFKEDDYIIFSGEIFRDGIFSQDEDVVEAIISVDKIRIASLVEVIDRPRDVLYPNVEKEIDGISVTLDSIEFSVTETRVFYTVVNNASYDARIGMMTDLSVKEGNTTYIQIPSTDSILELVKGEPIAAKEERQVMIAFNPLVYNKKAVYSTTIYVHNAAMQTYTGNDKEFEFVVK